MNTTYYRVLLPCGKKFPMMSLTGRTYDEALAYCRGIWNNCEIEEVVR